MTSEEAKKVLRKNGVKERYLYELADVVFPETIHLMPLRYRNKRLKLVWPIRNSKDNHEGQQDPHH